MMVWFFFPKIIVNHEQIDILTCYLVAVVAINRGFINKGVSLCYFPVDGKDLTMMRIATSILIQNDPQY